ncbi:MAG: XRE family transcriptional regulator [Oligoflexia bacterium]|nr:XRE family transcriptional regulator [Oligoflexia bacterium]
MQTTKFPSTKRLKQVNKHLSSSKVMGSSILPKNATVLERAKYNACSMIVQYVISTGIKQKELANLLAIDESRTSEILHYKIEKFTLDRLIGYTSVVYPKLKLSLKAA